MMKNIIILSTLAVLANASYEKAQEFYDAKEYANAIKEAKASTDEYSNPKLHLVWAKSEEALGNTKQAMSAYERVAILNQNDTDSRLKLVEIYNKTGRNSLARDMSKSLASYQLTPAQRSSLELLKSKDISSFKAKATFSVGHDSNINVSATSSALDDYTNSIGNEGEKSTLFARFNGSLSYINELDEKGGWYFRGDLKAYYQNNSDAHYYDMAVLGAEMGLGYAGNGYTLYLPVGYARVNYLDVDLLDQVSIAPKINISLSKKIILNCNVKYSSRTYNEAQYVGMGDSSFGVGGGLYYLFGKNFAYTNVLLENFSSSESVHSLYLDKQMLTASLGLNYNLTEWLVSRIDYKYRYGNYDDTSNPSDATSTTTRSDNYNQFELKLSHFFGEHYELFVSDRYINNSSNYVPSEYTKNIAMFGISANY
jgi:uncharacterized protein (DUF1330 family)